MAAPGPHLRRLLRPPPPLFCRYRLVSFSLAPFPPLGMPHSMRSINVILNSADVPARATMQVFFPLCGFPLEYVNKA